MHLAVSLALAAFEYWRAGRPGPAFAPVVSGFLVDADHFVDYLLYRRTAPHSLELARRRMILAFHGWEYLLALAALERLVLSKRTAWTYGLTTGYLVHLLLDQFSNELEQPLTYSLLYRASRRFEGPFFKPNDARAWRKESPHRLWRWL